MKKNKKENLIRSSAGEYLSYIASSGNGTVDMEVLYCDEWIWMTQKMMATMYDATISTINEHIHNIYKDNELIKEATIRKFRIVQSGNV